MDKSTNTKNISTKKIYGSVSVSRKLLNEGKINPAFMTIITYLTLEELIVLKLEQTAKLLSSPFLGFSLNWVLKDIVQDALRKYAFSLGLSNRHTAAVIGVAYKTYKLWLKDKKFKNYYKIYFEKYDNHNISDNISGKNLEEKDDVE